ncbi:sterol carrier protein domain-containing protein, partial [Nocardioides kribbensis]
QGRARVEATDEAPGVRLGVDTLGALYLGDRSVLTAAAAGRVTGSDVATWAAMADHAGPAPWNTTGF